MGKINGIKMNVDKINFLNDVIIYIYIYCKLYIKIVELKNSKATI